MRSPPSCRWTGATGWLSSSRTAISNLSASRARRHGGTACGRSRRTSPIWRLGGRRAASRCRGGDRGAALKFVAHHLWDPAKRVNDTRHGCLRTSARARGGGLSRCDGPRAPNTVRQRLASWRIAPLERHRGTVRRPESALSAAIGRSRAAAARTQEQAGRHPGCPGSADRNPRDDQSQADLRDLAILLLAFASAGAGAASGAAQRRAARKEPPAQLDPRDTDSPTLPCLGNQLGGPRPATPTRRAGASGRPQLRRCANGWSGPTSRRGQSSGRSTVGRRWRRRRSRHSRSI
jgi:hypothetical protein